MPHGHGRPRPCQRRVSRRRWGTPAVGWISPEPRPEGPGRRTRSPPGRPSRPKYVERYRAQQGHHAFVDASNRPWIRWQDGTLHELDQDPPEQYGMTELLGSDWG